MKNVKVNVYDLEKVFLDLKSGINLLEMWNVHEEKSEEIKLILKKICESLAELENITYGLDD